MITIKSIDWLDEERKEGELELTDGNYTMICFSDGIDFKLDDKIENNIFAMLSSDILRSFDKEFYLHHCNGFEYHVTGQIIDKEKGIIKIGDFLIQVGDSIPKDIQEEEFVIFEVERFDIF